MIVGKKILITGGAVHQTSTEGASVTSINKHSVSRSSLCDLCVNLCESGALCGFCL